MINTRTVFGLSLARQRVRRRLLVVYAILIFTITVLTALRNADSLELLHWQLRPLDVSDGIIAALFVFIVTRLVLGNVVDFSGARNRVGRTPFQFLNGFIDGLLIFRKKDYLAQIDERDVVLRNAVHYDAFGFIRSMALVVAIAALTVSESPHPWLAAPVAFLCTLAVIYLPAAIILWTEPDIEPEA